jgi:hypothetical protein
MSINSRGGAAIIVCLRVEEAPHFLEAAEILPRECERCHAAVVVHSSSLQAAEGHAARYICRQCFDAGKQEIVHEILENVFDMLDAADKGVPVPQETLRETLRRMARDN